MIAACLCSTKIISDVPRYQFAKRLQRLDRQGALPSVERQRLLREVRNSPAHEYSDHPELRAAALTRRGGGVQELLVFWLAARAFADRHFVD